MKCSSKCLLKCRFNCHLKCHSKCTRLVHRFYSPAYKNWFTFRRFLDQFVIKSNLLKRSQFFIILFFPAPFLFKCFKIFQISVLREYHAYLPQIFKRKNLEVVWRSSQSGLIKNGRLPNYLHYNYVRIIYYKFNIYDLSFSFWKTKWMRRFVYETF